MGAARRNVRPLYDRLYLSLLQVVIGTGDISMEWPTFLNERTSIVGLCVAATVAVIRAYATEAVVSGKTFRRVVEENERLRNMLFGFSGLARDAVNTTDTLVRHQERRLTDEPD